MTDRCDASGAPAALRIARVLTACTVARTLTALGLLALQSACGRAAAPQELQNARHAFDQAIQGPAGRFAPVQLDAARHALEAADRAYAGDSEERLVRDLAYIAERQVAIAVSAAALEQATRSIAAYDKQRAEIARRLQLQTQAELDEIKRRLAEAEAANRDARAALEGHGQRPQSLEVALGSLKDLGEFAVVSEDPRGVVITLAEAALFAVGERSLLPHAQGTLNRIAHALGPHREADIVVEGHIDAQTPNDASRDLSLARARAVRDYLIREGVAPEQVRAVGRGSAAPVGSNASPEGRTSNRRVEIIVVKSKSAADG
jgi:outer membrane protein OmpA-like peptidoglycan-associated protein